MKESKTVASAVSGICIVALMAFGVNLIAAAPSDPSQFPSRPRVIEFASDPSFSPDGRRLAYVKNGEAGGTVWLKEGNHEPVCVVTDASSVHRPVWSPDSRCIAYLRFVDGDFTGFMDCTVRILDTTTGQSVDTGLVVSHLQFEYMPQQVQWSPDSWRLVVSNGLLAIWDVGGAQATTLVERGGKAQFASFSPSGQLIGYTEYENGQAPLKVYDVVSGETRVPFTAGIYEPRERWTSAPEWLDENRVLVETENPDASIGVTLVDINTGSSQLLVSSGFMPQLSPDKSRFAYIAPDVWENDIYEMPSNVVTRLLGSHGDWFKWSPDGAHLLTWCRVVAVTFDARDGGQASKLLEGDALGVYPSWAPDGRSVAIPGPVGNGPGTIVFGLEGGN